MKRHWSTARKFAASDENQGVRISAGNPGGDAPAMMAHPTTIIPTAAQLREAFNGSCYACGIGHDGIWRVQPSAPDWLPMDRWRAFETMTLDDLYERKILK